MAKTPISYEIPTEMRDFAEKSVEQAKKAFDGFVGAAGKAVAAMHRLMRNATDWGLQEIGTTNGFQLRDAQGKVPASVQVILVNTLVSTALQMVELPKGRARYMGLVDACTIFDSIENRC